MFLEQKVGNSVAAYLTNSLPSGAHGGNDYDGAHDATGYGDVGFSQDQGLDQGYDDCCNNCDHD